MASFDRMERISLATLRDVLAAAEEGNTEELRRLIAGNIDALKQTAAKPLVRTPLHNACSTNGLIFVKILLELIPEFAEKQDECGKSPLHIAAEQGHVEIVKALVEGRQHLCLVKGPDNRIPLHCAIEKGKVEVMRELLFHSPDSVKETTTKQETGLHLAAKNNQHEAVVELVEHLKKRNEGQVINWKDNKGNTALHLAVFEKNFKVVEFMREKHAQQYVVVDVNARNNNGQRPLDFVEAEDREIRDILNSLGAIHGRERHSSPALEGESRADIRNALLVVAVLIASTTYQSVLQSPHFETKVNTTLTEGFHASYASYMTGFFGRDLAYIVFITGNTFGFLMSVQMIICLTRNLSSFKQPMFLSMALMVQTYYCHTYYLPFATKEKEFGLKNVELLSVLPLTIPILLLLIQKQLAEGLEFYLGKLYPFDSQRDMYHI